MKTLKTFKTFNESNDQSIGLDIKNDISKLIDGDGGTLDLGIIDDVSNTDINNIKQTYKDATIKVVDGHYILTI
jgi:hypothetical protein